MKQLLHSALHEWNLDRKRILLRADLNVPLDNGKIVNDYRLQQILPTITLIMKKGGTAVVISHLGRPQKTDPVYSLRQLIPWFEDRGLQVLFANNPPEAARLKATAPNQIILLENLRFFPGEQEHDEEFAKELASCGNYYVNDAFGTLHRNDTSITLTPRLFHRDRRTIGLLCEHELAMLKKLMVEPTRPYVLILGGAKVSDKIPLLAQLLDKIDEVLLVPAIVFTFLSSRGIPVGKSLVDKAMEPDCQRIFHDALRMKKTIQLPVDYQVAEGSDSGPLSIISADAFSAESVGISIGPKTIGRWRNLIANAGTIFFNGFPGIEERPETLIGTQEILRAMSASKAFTVVGGGDTVSMVYRFNVEKKIRFCSTGGGATIAYLSGEPLPGLLALETP